jgi:hypothetical protein
VPVAAANSVDHVAVADSLHAILLTELGKSAVAQK